VPVHQSGNRRGASEQGPVMLEDISLTLNSDSRHPLVLLCHKNYLQRIDT
jgi:hypothetical protein